MAGRPRGIDDAVLLQRAVEVVGRVGPAKLTLAAVATEAGVVPATLIQRFGSKHGLLVALAERSAKDAGEAFERLRERHSAPLPALEALAVESMAPMTTPETFANHLAFLCMDLTDPRLHEPALAVHEAQRTAIRSLLDEALARGELRAGTDTAELAESAQALIAGTGLSWALDRRGTLPQRLRDAIRSLLAPHTPTDDTEEP